MTKDKLKKLPPRKKLTTKQKRFIDWVVDTGNNAQAARLAWYKCKDNQQAANVWRENSIKPYIKVEIDERVKNAKNNIYRLAMTSEKDEIQFKASQDIVDRAEWKATIKIGWDDWLPFTVNIVHYGNKTDTDPT